MYNKLSVRKRTLIRILTMTMLFYLTACQAGSIKSSGPVQSTLKTIRVVAVEPPPLEVRPDLLEMRMPVYRHYNNMVLPLHPEVTIYRNPGGILIAGKIGQGDSVQEVNFSKTKDTADKIQNLRAEVSSAGDWVPTLELSKEAAKQLHENLIEAVPGGQVVHLPLAMNERSADLVKWRGAVERWYGLNTAAADYRKWNIEPVDAVLEIGIGQYKIFEGQTSLQLLIKLIASDTGQVIARTRLSTWSIEASAQALLDDGGTRFKELIREMGIRLMTQGFQKIGLVPKPLPAPSLPIPS